MSDGCVSRVRNLPEKSVYIFENIFYQLGVLISNHPWQTIAISVTWTVLFSIPFLINGFPRETSPIKLWVPEDSQFTRDTEWLANRFGAIVRPQRILAVADNILEPSALTKVAHTVQYVLNQNNIKYSDICFQVPDIGSKTLKKRSIENSNMPNFEDGIFEDTTESTNWSIIDFTNKIDPVYYCSIWSSLPMSCVFGGLQDLWSLRPEIIANWTKDDIYKRLDTTEFSHLGPVANFRSSLGGVQIDSYNEIISATSIMMTLFLRVNYTNSEGIHVGNDAGTEEWASTITLDWEESFLNIMENISAEDSQVKFYYEAGRSFGDLSGDSMFKDIDKLVIGIIMMFIYIQLIISKFNWVELKISLASVGLMCVGMALAVSYGVCSFLTIPYGPVHNSLPFLLMGLGIDDMFVMKACWEYTIKHEKDLSRSERIGSMLRHAGVSIVITSFTDIIAFLIGSITILPSLRSFCQYAAIGVFFIFVFSVTFYVAVFVLDLQRIDQKRNGAFICIKHSNYKPIIDNRLSISESILNIFYSKIVFTRLGKISIIIFTIAMSGFCLHSLSHLEQRFDPVWFLPTDSYYAKFLMMQKKYYPEIGYEGTIFTGALNYNQELPNFYTMIEKLQNEKDIVHNLDTWTIPFHTYVLNNYGKDVKSVILSDMEFNTYLSKFLFSPSGGKYILNFRFNGTLVCGKPTPPVIASSIDFRFKVFDGPKVYLPAKHRIEDIVTNANFTTGEKFATVWAKVFANWVTDEVIYFEVERNLELALICVMFCTLIFIANLQMCFWIFICVFLTLIYVCGWMYQLGLTIDIVTCVGLELGVGFCVDYAAHIGHTFLTIDGNRQHRAMSTVMSIGAAVFYGGGSTLLALSVLSFSKTYIFKTFFIIFLLVITFGLFNGLLFLPTILSLIGPAPYKIKHEHKIISNNDDPVQIEMTLLKEKVQQ